jgi:carbamoyl-phosphate synthase small subunit
MAEKRKKVRLVLEDGSSFEGYRFATDRAVAGEVVFNTGMVGYPETLTDPSYHGQILTLTYPLIGNYGVPGDESVNGLLRHFESGRIQVRGLIVAEHTDAPSHWNARRTLSEWMSEQGVPGMYGVDTRDLTKKLREKGTMLGKVVCEGEDIDFEDPNLRNLVAEVSVREPVEYPGGHRKAIIVDCGVKNSIIRAFTKRDITVRGTMTF